jgi:LuxR family maltose regulon positive regulatory protein
MSSLASWPGRTDDASALPPALATKLYPPLRHPAHVGRPRLVARLAADPARRVTLVSAPAGAGKSTLVAQWLARAAIPSAWVTLDAGSGRPRPFFVLVVAALRGLDPGLLPVTAALLADEGSFAADRVVLRLVDELAAATGPFALVLDDYHTVAAAETHRAVDLLFERAPPGMRVVLIGRSVPPLRSARSRAIGRLRPLGPPDLAFTRAEAAAYYRNGLGLDLAPGEVEAIHERTEGWAAGLQLAGIAVRGHPRGRIRALVADFESVIRGGGNRRLLDEVIGDLPADVLSFLLRTSVLDRFTAGLCDAVTGNGGSEGLIRRCERGHLFVVPLDGVGAWYRYHHLFAEALRDHLARLLTTDEIEALHRRAARWLAGHGLVEDAVRHAIAGRDWDGAVALLEGECAALFARDHVATIRDRLDGLPEQIFARSPRLAFLSAWSLGRLGLWSEAGRPFRIAEETWTKTGDRAGRGALLLWEACFGFDHRKAIARTHEALALLPEDRPAERMFALSIQAIAYVRRGEPARADQAFAEQRAIAATSGLGWFGLHAMAHAAGGLIQRGRLQEAEELCLRVIEAAGETPVELWVQAALYRLGSVHYEWGRLDDATESLRRADELAEVTGALQWRGRICVGLARLAWAWGEPGEAFGHLERALGYELRIGNDQPIRDVRAWQARCWLAANDLDPARRWADASGLDLPLSPEYERQVEHLTLVRVLIRDGRPERALAILDPIRRQAKATGRDGELVEVAVLDARARAAAGDTAAALRAVRRALALGELGGYVRVFADEGPALGALLRHDALRGDHRDYARRLLAEFDAAEE